jgi:hypothetical protein
LLALARILGAQSSSLLQLEQKYATMSDDEDIAALVIDNGSGMCKGETIACVDKVSGRELPMPRVVDFGLRPVMSPLQRLLWLRAGLYRR